MTTTNGFNRLNVSKASRSVLSRLGLVLALALCVTAYIEAAPKNAEIGRVYSTPEGAIADLKNATANADTNAMRKIFGPAADDLLNPDRVQAANDLAKFNAA